MSLESFPSFNKNEKNCEPPPETPSPPFWEEFFENITAPNDASERPCGSFQRTRKKRKQSPSVTLRYPKRLYRILSTPPQQLITNFHSLILQKTKEKKEESKNQNIKMNSSHCFSQSFHRIRSVHQSTTR